VRDKIDVTEMGLKSPYPVTGEVLGTEVTCAVFQTRGTVCWDKEKLCSCCWYCHDCRLKYDPCVSVVMRIAYKRAVVILKSFRSYNAQMFLWHDGIESVRRYSLKGCLASVSCPVVIEEVRLL